MKYNIDGLNELSKQINDFVKNIGFDNNDIPLRIALIHSEISEAFEAFRKDKICERSNFSLINMLYEQDNDFKNMFENLVKDTFQDEIADTIIRLLDLCGKLNIDIESHIQLKMRYNTTRSPFLLVFI